MTSDHPHLNVFAQASGAYTPAIIEDIQAKAETGRPRVAGIGASGPRPWATFDHLTFLPCGLTRIPLESDRESCSTKTVLGTRHAERPLELDIPFLIAGMSYGPLSYNAKVALARGSRAAGTSTTTGEGGMLPAERENARLLIYQVLPSRYGLNVHHLRQADAIELTIGQGANPGSGSPLAASHMTSEIARLRDLPPGLDPQSPSRHPDFLGLDDMILKIEELREATDWQLPVFVKLGAGRVFDDVRLAAKAGADVIVVDGREDAIGGSGDPLQEHTGVPTLAAVCEARAALEELGVYGEVQLILGGGIRHGGDAAKALALGADAVYVATAALVALNCNKPLYVEDYQAIGAAPHHCHHCDTGRCPVGITTQDPQLTQRLEIEAGAGRLANWLRAVTAEVQALARACGKRAIHNLEPEDLRALTLDASLITGIPVAGTNMVFGGGPGWKR